MTITPSPPEELTAAVGRPCGLTDALRLAGRAAESVRGYTTPNPPVGAIILDSQGVVCGIGATQPPGGPHAEIVALRQAGPAARGGTAVVTLEPCNTWGRTGPCSHALAEAGIAQLYYALPDTTSAAGGADYLAQRGVICQQATAAEVAPILAGGLGAWLHTQATGRPRITAKIASTLDGFSAAADGSSQWITGKAARADAHLERSRVDAIIVGTGTVRADNPALTARRADGTLYPRQPERIIVGTSSLDLERLAAYPCTHLTTRSWEDVLQYLQKRHYQDVLVEGGPRLVGDLIARDLVDRVIIYQAPFFLGQGLSAAYSTRIGTLPDAHRLHLVSYERVGADLKLIVERKH